MVLSSGCFSPRSMIVVFAFIVSTVMASPNVRMECGKGYYVHIDHTTGRSTCRQCGPGTFMPLENHTSRECWYCEDDPLPGSWKQVNRPCTPTSDTEIGCSRQEGYESFRVAGHSDDFLHDFVCLPCTLCEKGEVETKPCSELTDRKCGTLTWSKTDKGNGDEEGERSPKRMTCGAGHYLSRNRSTGKSECIPCPPDTYMPLESHRKRRCFHCDESDHSSQVRKPCAPTSNAEIGCLRSGSYRHPVSDGSFSCFPCKTCGVGEVEKVPCTENADRVCERLT